MKSVKINNDALLIGAAALAGLGLIVWASRAGMTQRVAAGAVGVVNDVAVGTIKGIGQVVGIPDTNATACQRAIAAGNWWDASFSCPAGTFLGAAGRSVFGSTAVNQAETFDARSTDYYAA